MQLFGQRAGPAMAALVSQGADALVQLEGELENSGGTAQRIAEVQMQGFNGAMKSLGSAFEGLQIAIAGSGFLDFLTAAVTWLAKATRAVAGFIPKIVAFGKGIYGRLRQAIQWWIKAKKQLMSMLGPFGDMIRAI